MEDIVGDDAAATAASGSSRYMQPSDWATHRDQITQLYREENKTLPQTMTLIEAEHGVKATVKMWKSKITEWGLDKKNKKDEVLTILRKKTERDNIGKKSVFKLRGRAVDYKDVQRYAARNHISDTTVAELIASHPNTPPDLQCLTPEAAPIEIARSDACYTQERILRDFRDYMTGSFEQRTWSASSDGQRITFPFAAPAATLANITARRQFSSSVSFAQRSLKTNNLTEAILYLNAASATVGTIVRSPSWYGILNFCRAMLHLEDEKAFSAVLRHTSDMAKQLLPTNDPRCLLYSSVGHLSRRQIQSLVPVATHCLSDEAEKLIGEINLVTLNLKKWTLKQRNDYDALQRWGRSLLVKFEHRLEPASYHLTWIRHILAFQSFRHFDFAAARVMCEEILSGLSSLSRDYLRKKSHMPEFHVSTLLLLGGLHWHEDNYLKSIRLVKTALIVVEEDHDMTYFLPRILADLEYYLGAIGEQLEAEQVKARRITILERDAKL